VPEGLKEVGALIRRAKTQGDFEIVYLVVSESSRRRGIGQGLVATALEAALAEGHERVACRVPTTHTGMLHLLLGLGFVPVGLDHPGEGRAGDLVIMERDLGMWLDAELVPAGHPLGCPSDHAIQYAM
jgi:GNAT superfamily N-acetyltransferase